MREEEPDRWLGAVVGGKYRIERVLGGGGMATVYAGRHVELGRRIAIKLLHPMLAREALHLARFRREAEAVSRLEHPHVVQVLDISAEGTTGPAYCVMELLDGIDWFRAVRERGPLAPDLTVRFGRQLLGALQAAHGAGVVHRDVKPSNVMIVRGYDGLEMVKLVDFGIAHMMETTGYTRLTQTGRILGTPTYMAPEQALGQPVDVRTDVYAAGAVLFTSLAGRPPFEKTSYHELLPRLISADRPKLHALRPDLPGSLADCVERAMSADPDGRFGSAAEMDTALASWQRGERTVVATTQPLPQRGARDIPVTRVGVAQTIERPSDRKDVLPRPSRTPGRRGTRALLLPVAVPLLLLAGAIAVWIGWPRPSDAPPPMASLAVADRLDAGQTKHALDAGAHASGTDVATDPPKDAAPDAPANAARTPPTTERTERTRRNEPTAAAPGARRRDAGLERPGARDPAPSGRLVVTVRSVQPVSWVYLVSQLREPAAERAARANRCLAGLSNPPAGGPWQPSIYVTIHPNGDTRTLQLSDTPDDDRVDRCLRDAFGGPGWPPRQDSTHGSVGFELTLGRR